MTSKRLLLSAAGCILLFFVAEFAVLASNVHTRRKGESLLSSLRTLKVGASTLHDAEPILAAYNGKRMSHGNCPSSDEGYGIVISNSTIFWLGSKYPALLRFGVRPVGVSATLSFAVGHLCEFTFAASSLLTGSQTPSSDQDVKSAQINELTTETTIRSSVSNEVPESIDAYEVRYSRALLRGYRASGFVLGMHVTIPQNAEGSNVNDALGFDLSCFTSLRGCRAHCQMLPSATRDALEKRTTPPSPVPEDEIKYQGCPA